MSQRGSWDVTEVMHITEGAFGTEPTTGTWLPVALIKRFEPRFVPVRVPRVGLGRQNPSDWIIAKQAYEFDIEVELLKKEAVPAYDPYTMVQYIIEKAATADGAPDTLLDSFSLGAKLDLTTDEFWHLGGCTLNSVEIAGRAVDDLVVGRYSGIAQNGDYNTTDFKAVGATRQAQPTAAALQVVFGDCDVLVDPTTPASIMEDVSSFVLRLSRTIERRGSDSTTPTLYRAHVPTARVWEVELVRDFDSRTELEQFVDATKVKCTIEVPNETGGKIYALTSGYWVSGSGAPISELDLMNMRLLGRFAELAVSTHA